jgi:hypothetical protein
VDGKFNGINTWLIIEILSFYGYLLAAIIFILENSIKSSLGILNKTHLKDRYKTDFIVYHREEIDWLAFVVIPLFVNTMLMVIEEKIIFSGSEHSNPLRHLMVVCLAGHTLHFLFLRNLKDDQRNLTAKNQWVWALNVVQYSYVVYEYLKVKDDSESRFARSWIPLDTLLTFLVAIYYYSKLLSEEDEKDE